MLARTADPESTIAPMRAAQPATGAPSAEPGWVAELGLHFASRGGATVLARRSHRGPLQVQRPFYPEGPAVCHVYLLHPPGGVVGGDRLEVGVSVAAGAHALVTTPAAGKLYRTAGPWARSSTDLLVAGNGLLEWLPQETIAYAGTRTRLGLQVRLAPQASFLGWEVLCLGRPAAGERFNRGEVRQSLALWRGEGPLLLERARLAGGTPLLEAPWGLGGWPVLATLLAVRPGGGLREVLHAAPPQPPRHGLAAVTEINGVLVGRCLTLHAEDARSWLLQAWRALRPGMAGRAACPPRIWRT